MGIFDKIGNSFHSLGSWLESNVAQPFSNKVLNPISNALSPIVHDITRPVRVVENIGTGVEKMSEAWANRASALTTDSINAIDKTIVGVGNISSGLGNFFSTPIIPVALGIGALYILKK